MSTVIVSFTTVQAEALAAAASGRDLAGAAEHRTFNTLVARGLLKREAGWMEYSLTPLGRKAHALLEALAKPEGTPAEKAKPARPSRTVPEEEWPFPAAGRP